MLKLNLGCGSNKIEGFVNIDTEASCKPDVVCNFITNKLPYKTSSVEEVVLFHTIEHISKRFHPTILKEIHRVLKLGGSFIVSYPEFLKCVDNWKNNFRGQKEFWEATLYGRQLYSSDFHVCIMHTEDFVEVLRDCGFYVVNYYPEPIEHFNTVILCKKVARPPSYEDLINNDMKRAIIVKKHGTNKSANKRKRSS